MFNTICQMSVKQKYLNTKSYGSRFTVLLAYLMLLISKATILIQVFFLFTCVSLFSPSNSFGILTSISFYQLYHLLTFIKIGLYNSNFTVFSDFSGIIKLTWTCHLPTRRPLVILCSLKVFHLTFKI